MSPQQKKNLWEELNTMSLSLALHILEPYITEGGSTTCSLFLIFFLQPLALALSGLLKHFLQLLLLEME